MLITTSTTTAYVPINNGVIAKQQSQSSCLERACTPVVTNKQPQQQQQHRSVHFDTKKNTMWVIERQDFDDELWWNMETLLRDRGYRPNNTLFYGNHPPTSNNTTDDSYKSGCIRIDARAVVEQLRQHFSFRRQHDKSKSKPPGPPARKLADCSNRLQARR